MSGRQHGKELNRKKMNQPIYKCSHYNSFDLESFCFEMLIRSKVSNPKPLRTTYALGPKKIWVPKVKL